MLQQMSLSLEHSSQPSQGEDEMLNITYIAVSIGIMILSGALIFVFSPYSRVTVRDDHDCVTHNPDDMNKLHAGTYRPQDDEGF